MPRHEALRADHDALLAGHGALERDYAALKGRYDEVEARLERLVEQMRLAARRQWGPSSEACRGQLPLLLNDAEGFADATLPEASPRRAGGKRGRVDWSAYETEVVMHDLAEEDRSCPACDAELAPMDYEVTRELVFVPARVRVVEHRTMKYVCPSCSAANRADGGETPAVVVRAEAPEGPIPGGPAIREKVTATPKRPHRLEPTGASDVRGAVPPRPLAAVEPDEVGVDFDVLYIIGVKDMP